MDPSWIEISRSALAHNLTVLKSLAGAARVAAVVKANAYGHGLALCGRLFAEAGADLLAVNDVAEVAPLRDLGTPIYVLGPTFAEQAAEIAALGCHVVTSSPSHSDAMAAAGRAAGVQVPVHIKVETGTNRQGLDPSEARLLADHVQATDGVRLAGIATHLADVEDHTEHTFARVQLDRFEAAFPTLPEGAWRHCASTAAHLVVPRSRYDMVRPGIGCYGLWPSRETRISSDILHGGAVSLQPALTWKTRVAVLKLAPIGGYVGYGRTERLSRATRIAVLPIGYYDGYDRLLSGKGQVLVGGQRAPVVGRVCMNMTMVDVTGIDGVAVGDEVVLLGIQGAASVTADEIAGWTGTINYEVTTRIHERLPRVEAP